MLSAIKANHSSSDEQYAEVLTRWIDRDTATVKKLIDALESKAVGQKRIASRLRQKYAKKKEGIAVLHYIL